MASQRVKKSKISWGRKPPDPPRVERALLAPRKSFALSQHSPVTLTYSPATVIFNENPGYQSQIFNDGASSDRTNVLRKS